VIIVGEPKGKPEERSIGVIDSGLGGLTVVRELERLLPGESIVYFGDNANCPYGNRPREEIFGLSSAMLDFLQKQEIKIAAIACNTISALADDLRPHFEFPIVSIIEAASEYVAKNALARVGVFATEFTISQGTYASLIKKLRPGSQVYGQPSRTLAALVDEGRFDDPATKEEVRSMIDKFAKAHPEVKNIVLGCTHYPIVQDLFEEIAPDLNFINPAFVQAKAVESILKESGLFALPGRERPNASGLSFSIFTSGEKPIYDAAIKKLGIKRRPVFATVKTSAFTGAK
jgi:glutamate racemase